MNNNGNPASQFPPGSDVMSLVSHTPDIQPGDIMQIVRPWYGMLCAVELPDGMIHRWFASFELRPQDNSQSGSPLPAQMAIVTNVEGHGSPPPVEVGTAVKIVRCFPTLYYDVILDNGDYHRWVAEFEVANPVI